MKKIDVFKEREFFSKMSQEERDRYLEGLMEQLNLRNLRKLLKLLESKSEEIREETILLLEGKIKEREAKGIL